MNIRYVPIVIIVFITILLFSSFLYQKGQHIRRPRPLGLDTRQYVFTNSYKEKGYRKPIRNRLKTPELNLKMSELLRRFDYLVPKTIESTTTIQNSSVIIYNRINKSGSSTLQRLVSKVSQKNGIKVLRGNPPGEHKEVTLVWIQSRLMVPSAVKDMADLLCKHIIKRKVFIRLLYYHDFNQYGCHVSYFTQIRDPVDRFISRYYFNRDLVDRKGWTMITKFYTSQIKDRSAVNLEDCISEGYSECLYEGVVPRFQRLYRPDSQITWFCGVSQECRTLGHPKALETAIINIERDFVVVGLLDEVEISIFVMECLMPDYLKGLNKYWKENQEHANSAHDTHLPISDETRQKLKQQLNQEYVLYNYLKDRLN